MHQRVTAKSDAYGTCLMRRLAELAAFTEVPGQLTRRYLTPAHLAVNRQVAAWLQAAGLRVWTDALFSVFGRYEGQRANAPAIMLGSHLDTVLDAGRYDGALGALAAIAVVAEVSRRATHILTSSALIGAVEQDLLESRDIATYLALHIEQGPVPSGAGHDAGSMARYCPAGVLFPRGKDGISHNPAEAITVEDADAGVRALLEATRRLDHRLAGNSAP